MRMRSIFIIPALLLAVGCALSWLAAQEKRGALSAAIDRTVLPTVPPKYQGKIGQNYKESTPDWGPALPLAVPANSPNVLVIILDVQKCAARLSPLS